MKKFLILTILIVLILSIFLIKPKLILAETPDSFLMNELYLFNRDTFNLDPNFENGYLMKTTILPTDINDDNTSGFFGWYQNLGYRNLIIPYYGSDNDNLYVVFGVPLNGITATNFQLAYNVSTPTLLDFYLIFTDGTYEEWDTEQNGFGNQFLDISPSNRTKNCYAFCWEAYSPDYVPSFRFLGVTEGYELGFQNGYSKGKSEGYIIGRTSGYNAGFQDGITNTEEVVYDKLLNFNQIVKNGNFINTDFWIASGVTLTANDNVGTITLNDNATSNRIRQEIIYTTGHKYYFKIKINTPVSSTIRLNIFGDIITETIEEQRKITYYFDETTGQNDLRIYPNIDGNLNAGAYINVSDINIFDLTEMYGAGYEPPSGVCSQIFVNDYYNYTLGTAVDIGYYTGYYEGKNEGINEGINIGESNQINMSWIQSIFQAMQGFFNIQVFPHVTLGIIVGIPFVISLAWFVIKMFRGGGGGEE